MEEKERFLLEFNSAFDKMKQIQEENESFLYQFRINSANLNLLKNQSSNTDV